MSAASAAASPAKLVSASASSTTCAAGARERRLDGRDVGAHSRAGADENGVAARRRAARRTPGVANGATITAVRCAALTATASGGLATVTRPAPERSAARAASRAAPVRCAETDEHERRAARVFVARPSAAAAPRARPPARWRRLAGDRVERGGRDADVGEPDRAAVRPPRHSRCPGLRRKKVTLAVASPRSREPRRFRRRGPRARRPPARARRRGEGVDALDDRWLRRRCRARARRRTARRSRSRRRRESIARREGRPR